MAWQSEVVDKYNKIKVSGHFVNNKLIVESVERLLGRADKALANQVHAGNLGSQPRAAVRVN